MHAPSGHLHAHVWAVPGQPLGSSPTRSALVGTDTRRWADGGQVWEPATDHLHQVDRSALIAALKAMTRYVARGGAGHGIETSSRRCGCGTSRAPARLSAS